MGPLPDNLDESEGLVDRDGHGAWSWTATWAKQEPRWALRGDRELWARAWGELAERHRYITQARIERYRGPRGSIMVTARWLSARWPLGEEHSEIPARFGTWTKSLDDRVRHYTPRPQIADPW